VADAVIFDWYGTLAEWEHAGVSNYATVLSALGYDPDIGVIDAYHARWDGVEHRAYSTSREAYVAWTRRRLQQLAHECGVVDDDADHVVEGFVNSDYGTRMVAYPDAIPTLRALREHGIAIAVCSNWGWELDSFLEATGVKGFVDVAVTSARAGLRKPHPGIYEIVLQSIGVEAADTVFVGDSWGPDVLGPLEMGMAAVHVVRDASSPSPELLPRTYRVTALDQLLSMAIIRSG
jgi:putative hydrolase of the HAD superfamily